MFRLQVNAFYSNSYMVYYFVLNILICFFIYSSKFENLINQTDDDTCSLDSKLESKKKMAKELPKLKKSVIIKNTSAMEVQALEEVTEQTLRVNFLTQIFLIPI